MTRGELRVKRAPTFTHLGPPLTEPLVDTRPTTRSYISLMLSHSQHYHISTGTWYISDAETKFPIYGMLALWLEISSFFCYVYEFIIAQLIWLAPKEWFLYIWGGGFLQRTEKVIPVLFFVHFQKKKKSLLAASCGCSFHEPSVIHVDDPGSETCRYMLKRNFGRTRIGF